MWLDQLDIAPGDLWDVAVERALIGSPLLLVILSPASVASPNVQDEVSFALSKQRRIIPVLYRDCEIPYRLHRFQYVDLKSDYVRGLGDLLRNLQVKGGLEAEKSLSHTERRVIKGRAGDGGKYWTKAVFIFLGVLIVATLLYWLWQGTRPRWRPQTSGTGETLHSVAFTTLQSGWTVGDKGTILHTEDGGLTWKPQTSGSNRTLLSVTFATSRSGWAVGVEGTILHTEDGGTHWTPQTSGAPTELPTAPVGTVMPATLRSVTFTTPLSGWVVGDSGALLHTEDGGGTWKRYVTNDGVWLYAITFSTTQYGWAIGHGSLRTDDGGYSWKPWDILSSVGGVLDCNAIVFPTPQRGWMICGYILHTDDGGNGWHLQRNGLDETLDRAPSLNSMAFLTPRSGWIVGNAGTILHTEDAGISWKKQTSPTGVNLLSVAFPTPNSGWAVGDHGTILHYED